MTVPCPAPCSSLLHCLWQLLKSLTVVVGPGAHLLRAALLQGRDVGPACESNTYYPVVLLCGLEAGQMLCFCTLIVGHHHCHSSSKCAAS